MSKDLLTESAPEKVWLQVDVMGSESDRGEPLKEDDWESLSWYYESLGGQEVSYTRDDIVESLKAKLARVEALAMAFGAMEIGANAAADRSEYPQDHLQNVGRAQAYCECREKLREALGEKETG